MKNKKRLRKRLLGFVVALLMTIELLPGMSLTAYADTTEGLLTTITATGKEQADYSVENIATFSFSYTANGSSDYYNNGKTNWGWWGYGWKVTVTPVDGYTITKCVFYDDKDRTATDSEAPFVVETTEKDKEPQVNGTPILAYQSKGITKIEVYGYANPTTITSSVTLNTNGGTINSGNITTYEEGTGATLPTDVTKEGYTFAGWYDNDGLTGNAITSISTTDTGDKTFYAKWIPITYTITYENLLDGTNPNTINSYTIESPTITFENPTRTGYTGSWNPSSIESGSTGNKTITAAWGINKYTVTFKDYNGTVLKTQNDVEYNTSATAPTDPTRAGYTFTGWDKALTNITEDTTITATYSINSYTVTWTNYDDTVLKTDTVDYGETPAYTGATPTKPADAQYTYTFVGWTPEINTVTGDVTYKATYTNAKNKYTVKWLNYDNTVLQEGTVDFGVTPEYTGITPTKPADEQYTYTFLSWTPVVVPVVDNVVYIATYNNTVNKYTIKFVDEDGTEISSAEYDYGTSANDIVKPNDPTKDATAEYTYTFAGWDLEVTDVTGNKTYKATYTNAKNKYTVKWLNYDNTVLQEGIVEYGVTPEYTGTTPTKSADEQYTYTFVGWSPDVNTVTGDVTYKATYTQTEIKKDDGEKAVSTEVKKDEKSPEVKAANLTNEFAESTLSNEEKADIEDAINNGEDVKVDVYLEIEDISDAISASDKEKIKASATNADNIEYFDISLFKEISISGQTLGATSVHDLTAPLKLTMGVPKSFPAVADGYTRTYKVLRLHDGSVTVLPTTLNADGTLSFETDKFSTYALAYTDTKKEEVTTETPTTETPTTEAPTTKVDTPTTEAPKADTPKAPTTGDKINLGVIVMLMIDSALAGLYLTLRRKMTK